MDVPLKFKIGDWVKTTLLGEAHITWEIVNYPGISRTYPNYYGLRDISTFIERLQSGDRLRKLTKLERALK